MVNIFTNINKTNNHLSPQIIEHQKRPWQSNLLLVGLRVRIMCLSSMFSPLNENLNLLLWIKFFILFLYSSFKKNWKNGPKTKFYWFCAGGLVLIVKTECCFSELHVLKITKCVGLVQKTYHYIIKKCSVLSMLWLKIYSLGIK